MADQNNLVPQMTTQGLPALPKFNFQSPTGNGTGTGTFNLDPNFANITRLLATPQQSMTNSAIPAIASLYSSGSSAIQPQINAIRQRGEENAATAQSDAMKRGITGSDIEAAGMVGARNAASNEESQVRGQFSLDQIHSIATYLMQSLGFDIQQNSGMFTELAQAIGQKMSNDQSAELFKQQLAAGLASADKNAHAQIIGSLIGAGGNLAKGAMTAGMV